MFLLIVFANKQISRTLKSLKFGSKIAKKCKIRINCRRKPIDSERQKISQNIQYDYPSVKNSNAQTHIHIRTCAPMRVLRCRLAKIQVSK